MPLKGFFKMSITLTLRLHPKMFLLLPLSTSRCLHVSDEKGCCFNPHNLYSLTNISLPITGAHLQQFVSAPAWIPKGSLKFNASQPGYKISGNVYEVKIKQKQREVVRIQLAKLRCADPKIFWSCKCAIFIKFILPHSNTAQHWWIYSSVHTIAGLVSPQLFQSWIKNSCRLKNVTYR